jgi:hypothetical protein
MVIIGIDPGLDGGLAAISDGCLTLSVMPVVEVGKKRQLDEQALVTWLTPYVAQKSTCFVY